MTEAATIRPSGIAFLAVGASGPAGLHDIKELLGELPKDFPLVVLAVLHRASDKVSYLQEVLQRPSHMPVLIPEQHDQYRPGCCYIGEPASHITLIAGHRAGIIAGRNHLYRNRTVDLLFHSMAANAGIQCIGLLLSGILDDGSRGLAAIHRSGGVSMVIGASGIADYGMPESAARYDQPIDFIGSVVQIADEIKARIAPLSPRGVITQT
jgi:two-component system, chemotaxis family, protein-glutamate methylesterase/glutaminase